MTYMSHLLHDLKGKHHDVYVTFTTPYFEKPHDVYVTFTAGAHGILERLSNVPPSIFYEN